MITIKKEFDDAEDMDKFIREYFREYAPAGYGTSVKIQFFQTYKDWENNKRIYKIEITRGESCD